MKVIIDIPNSLYANLPKIVNGSIASKRILDCVKNGIPLPKGHGRLIDADKFINSLKGIEKLHIDDELRSSILETINSNILVEAEDNAENKEYGVKVINRGNCMLCGKKLTEGLLFCKECEAKGRKER